MKFNKLIKIVAFVFFGLVLQHCNAQSYNPKPERKDIITNLIALNELLMAKNYEKAKNYVWSGDNLTADELQAALERFVENKEISREGISILSSKGAFGTLKDIFPDRAETWTRSLKLNNISELYAITYGTAEVAGYWNGSQFKFFRLDDVGKLEDERIFEKVEIEAGFPGGDRNWKSYLEANCNGEVAANHKAPVGIYTVIIQFVIDKEGNISNVKALTNMGYGMEEEAIRVIKAGPKWIPAVQQGHYVKAYRKQPITFQVTKD